MPGTGIRTIVSLITPLLLLKAATALAVPFGFSNITANNPADAIIGETQLFVDVTDAGMNQALFRFFNTGPAASSITDVYFDGGPLLRIASINNSAGVLFSQDAAPPNLPGGKNLTPPFQVTAGLSADADSPTQPNGVNPGESLGSFLIYKVVGHSPIC